MTKKTAHYIVSIIFICILACAIILFLNNDSDNNVNENNLFVDEYIKVGVQGKFGLMDKTGNEIMPCKFDDVVYDTESQMAIVLLDGKWGYSNKNGNIIIKPQYETVGKFGASDLAPVLSDGKWGYINKKGELVIDNKFHNATEFTGPGYAVVKGDEWPFYIDENGEKAFDIKYDMLGKFNENGYAVVSKKEKFGIINSKGEEVVKPKYDKEFSVDSENYAVVYLDNKAGVIDAKGKEIIPAEYDFVIPTLAMYDASEIGSGFAKAYYIIFVNQLLETHNLFDENGIAIIVKDKKAGLINSKGDVLIEPQYEQIQVYRDSEVVLVSDGDKYMYYDIKGNQLANGAKFDRTNGFNSGLGVVLKDEKWGYINKKGEYVIEPIYEAAGGFARNGLAAVRSNEKWGYINKKGNYVIEPSYMYGSAFVNNVAKITDGKKWTLINKNGTNLCSSISEPALYNDGFAIIEEKSGKLSLYDLNGNLIAKTKYDTIGNSFKSSVLCRVDGCYNISSEEDKYCTEHTAK